MVWCIQDSYKEVLFHNFVIKKWIQKYIYRVQSANLITELTL